jgi:dTDP-4-amino-4,6-dideoxygalactose transaminase
MSPANNILRTTLVKNKQYYPFETEAPPFWKDTVYDPDSCPNVDLLQETVMRLPVDQRYTDQDITETINAVRKVWAHYFKTQA